MIGGTLLFKERTANSLIFGSLFGNPVDMVRIASLMTLNGKDIFGAGGAALLRFLGGETLSLVVLIIALSLWVVAPLISRAAITKASGHLTGTILSDDAR